MSAHTPGPWHIATAITTEDTIGAIAVVRRSIFAVFSPAARGDADSDARLIAAAPEMLEALKAVVEQLRVAKFDGPWLDHAKAAIAKAEVKP